MSDHRNLHAVLRRAMSNSQEESNFVGANVPDRSKESAAAVPRANQALSKAKKAKQDEFYTQLGDIANELKHYRVQLRGKTILCNCDDPFESNFFKYFALNFNALGLKKLIVTSYVKSPIAGGQLPLSDLEGLKPEGREPCAIADRRSAGPERRRRDQPCRCRICDPSPRRQPVAHFSWVTPNMARAIFEARSASNI